MSEPSASDGSRERRSGLATAALYSAAVLLATLAIVGIVSAFLPEDARARIRGSWPFAAAGVLLLVCALVSPDIRGALSNLKLAVTVIGLLAGASIIGTMFPQHPGLPPGDAGRMLAEITADWKPIYARAYTRFGLWDVWHTWWYRLLLVLVLLSVSACTINALRSVVRRYRSPRVALGPKAFGAQAPTAPRTCWRARVASPSSGPRWST